MTDYMQKVAERLLGRFELTIRDEGTREERAFWVFKHETFGTDDYDQLSNLMRELDVGTDFAYEEVHNALEDIGEMGEDYDDDSIFERSEADVYTYDLNQWMAAHTGHQEYVNEALREMGGDANDLVQLIAMGQSRAKERIRYAVRDLVQEMASELEYDELMQTDEEK